MYVDEVLFFQIFIGATYFSMLRLLTMDTQSRHLRLMKATEQNFLVELVDRSGFNKLADRKTEKSNECIKLY